MPELSQGLGFYLSNTFPGYIKDLAYFFQSPRVAVSNPEAQTQDLLFPFRERGKDTVHLLFEHAVGRGVGG